MMSLYQGADKRFRVDYNVWSGEFEVKRLVDQESVLSNCLTVVVDVVTELAL